MPTQESLSQAKSTRAGKHRGPIPGKNEDAGSREPEECVDLMVEMLLTLFGLRGDVCMGERHFGRTKEVGEYL